MKLMLNFSIVDMHAVMWSNITGPELVIVTTVPRLVNF